MQNRRDFLKTAALAAAGASLIGCKGFTPRRSGGPLTMKFFPYELQLRHTFTVASYSRTVTPDVQVEISWEGVTGYGEASMPPYLGQSVESVCRFLDKVDLSQFNDPFRIEDRDALQPGDLVFFGSRRDNGRPRVSHVGFYLVVREKTLEAAGKFNILKVKVGLDSDEQMIRAIRSVTDVPLAVDANQGWKDREKALEEIFWLREQGVVMVEQPMAKERIDDNAWLTERSPLPIFADESIQRLADIPSIQRAYSGINIKLMKCTGMREGWRMAQMARALGMKVMVGCMTETSCGISAAAQFSPYVDFADLDGNLLISNDRFDGVKVIDGRLSLPDRPGIGVTLL